jgi:hypothetical protein
MYMSNSTNRFKKMRKLAEQITKGFVPTIYMPLVESMTRKGKFAGKVVMQEGCTRAVYQKLKRTA